MIIHTVFFWLRDDLSDGERKKFTAALTDLEKIEVVRSLYIGAPADSEKRTVVDDTYSLALVTHFADTADGETYQHHPVHTKFVKHYSSYWDRVLVYDIDDEAV